jgi:hypothetical protein
MSARPTHTVESSFDLLGGNASHQQRRRLVFFTGIGLLVVLTLGLGGRAAASLLLTRRVDTDVTALRQQKVTLGSRLTGVAGADETTMASDLQRVNGYIDKAMTNTVDQAGIIARLNALGGGRLDGVQFSHPKVVGVTTATTVPDGNGRNRANTIIMAPGAGVASSDASNSGLVTVVIVGKVDNQTAVNTWIDQVKAALPELTTTNVNWKNGSDSQNVLIGGPTPSHWHGYQSAGFTVTITGTMPVGDKARADTLHAALNQAVAP